MTPARPLADAPGRGHRPTMPALESSRPRGEVPGCRAVVSHPAAELVMAIP